VVTGIDPGHRQIISFISAQLGGRENCEHDVTESCIGCERQGSLPNANMRRLDGTTFLAKRHIALLEKHALASQNDDFRGFNLEKFTDFCRKRLEEEKQRLALFSSRRLNERKFRQREKSQWAIRKVNCRELVWLFSLLRYKVVQDVLQIANSCSDKGNAQHIITFGDCLATNGFGYFPTPVRRLAQEFTKNGCWVGIVKEAYTSKRCSHCGSNCVGVEKNNKEIWALRECTNEQCQTKWDRDVK
jgi:hypothetical protein